MKPSPKSSMGWRPSPVIVGERSHSQLHVGPGTQVQGDMRMSPGCDGEFHGKMIFFLGGFTPWPLGHERVCLPWMAMEMLGNSNSSTFMANLPRQSVKLPAGRQIMSTRRWYGTSPIWRRKLNVDQHCSTNGWFNRRPLSLVG